MLRKDSVPSQLSLYSIDYLKMALLDKIRKRKTNVEGEFTTLTSLYLYYKQGLLAQHLLKVSYELEYKQPYMLGDMLLYLTKVLTIEEVIASWLHVDSKLYPDFEDLGYGLVLQYPKPIMRAAAFLIGLTSQVEMELLDKAIYRDIQQQAQALIGKHQPQLSKGDLAVLAALAENP